MTTTSSWADSQEGISSYFTIFLSLLAFVLILAKCIHDRPKLMLILSESGMTILVGIISSSIIYIFSASSEENDDSSDDLVQSLLSFSPKIFFVALLPPIIFNSGYHLNGELFIRHLTPISLFACLGTFISAITVAIILEFGKWILFSSEDEQQYLPHFTELLTFGGLISATDPVSTLVIFQAKKVDPHLFYLVFGESVLNDAVGLVLYQTFADFVGKDYGLADVSVALVEFAVSFCITFLGSMICGIICGMIAAYLLKALVDMRSTPHLELSFYVLIMYLPFLFASIINLSGVVTILFTAISAKRYAEPNLSPETQTNSILLFSTTAHLAETCIFLELGLSLFGILPSFGEGKDGNNNFGNDVTGFIVMTMWTIAACLVGRALNVYPITHLYNFFLQNTPVETNSPMSRIRNFIFLGEPDTHLGLSDSEHSHNLNGEDYSDAPQVSVVSDMTCMSAREKDGKIRSNIAHMLWFSGLRGAVAYACAKTFPNNFGNRILFVRTTMVIVLITVFLFGGTTECMLNFLHIKMNIDEDQYMQTENTREKMSFLRKFENRFLNPYLLRDPSSPSPTIDEPPGDYANETTSSLCHQIEMTNSDNFDTLCREGYVSVDIYRKRKKSLYDYGHGK